MKLFGQVWLRVALMDSYEYSLRRKSKVQKARRVKMINTVESLFEPGLQKAISSVSDYLNSISDYLSTQTRDELLGPELVHFAKGGP